MQYDPNLKEDRETHKQAATERGGSKGLEFVEVLDFRKSSAVKDFYTSTILKTMLIFIIILIF